MGKVTGTGARVLDAALEAFGTRGYEATSLDALAGDLGVTKQTILYWYPSKDVLLEAVIERSATELRDALESAITRSGSGLDRLDAVMRTVFRFAVRRPAVLGLLREAGRLGPEMADHVGQRLAPLVERAVDFLRHEMDQGVLRRADPRLMLLLLYTTVVGVATEAEAQRAIGISPSAASLARLRRELFAFVRAAVANPS
jgi:AcrR family transcriptional regulator